MLPEYGQGAFLVDGPKGPCREADGYTSVLLGDVNALFYEIGMLYPARFTMRMADIVARHTLLTG